MFFSSSAWYSLEYLCVVRLATVDSKCKPHLTPVVFVYDNDCYFLPIDQKSKRSKPKNLKRTYIIQMLPCYWMNTTKTKTLF
jgi:hypothetical protein